MIRWTHNKINQDGLNELIDVLERLKVIKLYAFMDKTDAEFWLEKLENDEIYYTTSIFFKIMPMPTPVGLVYAMRFMYNEGVTSASN